ncbi:MAG: heme exporter protein CcmD [Alphaproteobacteria bacterium]|nr:heme exporter protein CcmD [Alphaproteobacteria bacterium]
MSSWFAMGGYAAYVWPAYIIVAGTLAALWLVSRRTLKALEAEVELAEAENPRRKNS